MGRGPSKIGVLLGKAREAALQAVAAYNNPMATFKSGTYVVLMHVAWTALLLAILHKQKIKPFYRKPGSIRFERIEGRRKVWDLRECVRQYWGGADDAVAQNLRFFIGLRNLIEHADVPGIDLEIFGECQALLFNFEELMGQEFGNKYVLHESLAISLQFSRMRDPATQQALRQLLRPVPQDIKDYIEQFRSGLSADVRGDMAYSYKVFLVPLVGNHRSRDALAVEFVPYDANNPQEYDRLVTLIKQKLVPALNVGMLKPSDVAAQVAAAIGRPFSASYHHARAWRYWGVRPEPEAANPAATDSRYCVYDPVHKDYVYTEEWVQFLITGLQEPGVYEAVLGVGGTAALQGPNGGVPVHAAVAEA